MSRFFVDDDLREWEAYVSPARGRIPAPGRIAFRRVPPGIEPALAVPLAGSRAEAEGTLASASEPELRALLARAEPLR